MMKKSVCWKTVLLVLFLFSLVSAFVSGEILGKINTLYGDVKIDAFGINSYLDAIIGDILYNNTVLYFPAGSKAIILLRNKLFNIIATKNNQIIIRYKENQSQILSHHYVAIFDLL